MTDHIILYFAIILFFNVPLPVSAQKSGAEQSLQYLLKEVSKRYNIRCAYERSIVNGVSTTYQLPAGNHFPLHQLLTQLLKPHGLTFVFIKSTQYAIIPDNKCESPDNKKIPLKATCPEIIQHEISGYITTDDGTPVPGVTINVYNGQEGTLSDKNGYYHLKLNSSNTVLTFSSISFLTEIIPVEKRKRLNVTLHKHIKSLQPVEVSTGYQVLPKERQTSALGWLTAGNIRNKNTLNVVDRLEGMISGVLIDVKYSDESLVMLKEQRTMSIRGVSTIRADKSPLVVLDGFPTVLDINTINPEDIERVTVLKDAAAASIWGVKAANGVIVIDTKKGGCHKTPVINFSTSLTLTGRPRLDYLPIISSADLIDFEQELVDKNLVGNPVAERFSSYATEAKDLMLKEKRGEITTAEKEARLNILRSIDYKQQFQRYLLQRPASQLHNFSVAGGNAALSYFCSSSYAIESPNIKRNINDRWTTNLHTDIRLLKRFHLSTRLNTSSIKSLYSNLIIDPFSSFNFHSLLPYSLVVGGDGKPVKDDRVFDADKLNELETKGYLPWRYSFLEELNNSNNTYRNFSYRFNVDLSYQVLPSLSASVKMLQEKSVSNGYNYFNDQTYFVRNMINTFTSVQPNTGKLVYGLPLGSMLYLDEEMFNHYSWRGQLNYGEDVGKKHRVDAIGGAEIREQRFALSTDLKYGYNPIDHTFQPVNYDTEYPTVYNTKEKPYLFYYYEKHRNRYLSYFTNFNYAYAGKYILSGSARLDDSNLFGVSSKYRTVPLWSAGLAWRIGDEKWMQYHAVNDLVLRLTFGLNGNVDKSTGGVPAAKEMLDYWNNISYSTIERPANPYLRWEKTATFNIGIDFALLLNRLSGSLDIYRKKSTDLLYEADLNPTFGFSVADINTAAMKGSGIDLTLNAKIIKHKNWNWNSLFIFTYNKNEVTKVDRQRTDVTYYLDNNAIKGKSLNYLYSYRYGGLDNQGKAIVLSAGKEKNSSSRYPINNDLDVLTYNGVTVPPYSGGWTNTFSYKALDLSILLIYKAGHVFRRPSIVDYCSYYYAGMMHKDMALRWRKPGDERITDVPGIPESGGTSNEKYYVHSDRLVEKAGYIRLREINLQYQVPLKSTSSSNIKALQIGIQGRNLAIFTSNHKGIDPDFIPSEESFVLPSAPSFSFSIRAKFR